MPSVVFACSKELATPTPVEGGFQRALAAESNAATWQRYSRDVCPERADVNDAATAGYFADCGEDANRSSPSFS